MPLARIITRSAEEAQELTTQLRARGFAVEIVSPEQAVSTTADLVIRMEECSVEEALSTAGLFESSVFVAPGATAGTGQGGEIPMPGPVKKTGAQENRAQDSFVTPQNTAGESGSAYVEDPACGADKDAWAESEAERGTQQQTEVYVYEDAKLSPLQGLRLPRIRLPHFSLPWRRFPRFAVPSIKLRLPQVRLHLPKVSLHAPSFALRMPKPVFRVPRWSWPQAVFSVRVSNLRVLRPSFHIPKLAVRVPRVNWRFPQLARIVPNLSLMARRQTPVQKYMPERRPQATPTSRRDISNALFWDTAIAFGILAISVLMVGAVLHSKTPLPASLTQQVDSTRQQVPFAAVKRTSPSASPVATPIVPENLKSSRIATPELAAQRKPSPQVSHRPGRLRARNSSSSRASEPPVKMAQRSRSGAEDEGYVADDVVIHYPTKN